MREKKPNKQPIAFYDHNKDFTTHQFQIRSGMQVYLFSDGYGDQFGGPNAKKYKSRTLREYLASVYDQPVEKQIRLLEKNFMDWKGKLDQVDDVAIGIIRF